MSNPGTSVRPQATAEPIPALIGLARTVDLSLMLPEPPPLPARWSMEIVEKPASWGTKYGAKLISPAGFIFHPEIYLPTEAGARLSGLAHAERLRLLTLPDDESDERDVREDLADPQAHARILDPDEHIGHNGEDFSLTPQPDLDALTADVRGSVRDPDYFARCERNTAVSEDVT